MARIRISEYCKTSRVTRGDGAHLRRAIEEHWSDSSQLVLDFAGVRIASVSFFDESLGLLAKSHPIDELTARVRVENIDPADRALLNHIVLAREKERQAAASERSTSSRSRIG
jgi:hypothetical protein